MYLNQILRKSLGRQRWPPGKEGVTKNIDRVRRMDIEEMAGFLAETGAETPMDICMGCEKYSGEDGDCGHCKYNDEEEAWKGWLVMEAR